MQKLIQNVIKHAQADILEIQLEQKSDSFILSISDDGVGFDTQHSTAGLGLQNIRSRVKLSQWHLRP